MCCSAWEWLIFTVKADEGFKVPAKIGWKMSPKQSYRLGTFLLIEEFFFFSLENTFCFQEVKKRKIVISVFQMLFPILCFTEIVN